MAVIGSAYVLISVFSTFYFFVVVYLFKIWSKGCLVLWHILVYVFQYFHIMRLEAKSWFKLSFVIALHAVACCPVSCANNCSFVGSRWELDQGIYLWVFSFFVDFSFFPPPSQNQTKITKLLKPKHKTPLTNGSHPSSTHMFVLEQQLIGWCWRGESIMTRKTMYA